MHIRLPDQSFQILLVLLENPGRMVPREELHKRLWPADTFVEFDHNLNNAISRLRDALGDSADSPRFIETLPRRGYRFVAEVTVSGAGEPKEAARAAVQAVPAAAPAARRGWLLALGVVVAVVASVVLYRALNPATHPIDSVAVLPFVTADAKEGSMDDYVAFGMTEALIAELSRIGELKVISQTSVLQYQGTRKPLPQIARELGVGAIVEGSVVGEGDRIRLTVQLIEAASDTHLWAETYRRDTAEVMAVQSHLAEQVAGEIRARLTGKAAAPPRPLPRVNPAVEEAYVKGRYFWQRRGEDNMARARDYFRQAIAADPNHARAHAALADYYTITDSLPPAEAYAKAKAYARRALELDDDLADAHLSLAYASYYGDWNWSEAESRFKRAIGLDPNSAQARYWYGRFLGTMGRHPEAQSQIQYALTLDPVSVTGLDSAAMQGFFSRQFEGMIQQANRIRELDPNDYRAGEHLAVAYLFTGRLQEAQATAQRGLALLPREPLFVLFLAVIEDRLGRAREAGQMLATLERMGREGYVPDVFRAIAFAQTGRDDQALQWLQTGYRNRDPYMVMIGVIPWFDPLRADPRFQDLLRRMNFPQ
ncbi:MAG: winged helix-turn-helix domain-containing protein [Candidatus Acidiferrales bacterium]